MAGHMEKEYESGGREGSKNKFEIKSIQTEKLPQRSRQIPQWELLSKLVPPPEQVSQLKQELKEAASKIRTKGAQREGEVESIFNPSPGRYQKQTSPDLTPQQCKSAKEGKLKKPESMHQLTYLLLMHLVKAKKLSEREFGKSVALYSSPGCEMQDWHIDFSDDPKPTKKAKLSAEGSEAGMHEWAVRYQQLEGIRGMGKKPRGVFWALEKGCKIMLAGPHGEAVEVCLQVGDVLLFDGDLVHAGAAYPDTDNIRMHVYLYAEGIVRPGKGTWFVPEFVPTKQISWQSSQARAAGL